MGKTCRLAYLRVLGKCNEKDNACENCCWYESKEEVEKLKNKIYGYKINKTRLTTVNQ